MKSLREWEADFTEQIKQVELLGELDLTAKLLKELGQLIGRIVEREQPAPAIQVLEQNYPISLAVYLVAQGTHGYKSGSYWPEVQRITGIPPNYGSRLGQFFERFLDAHGLPLFTKLEGLRYLSRILLHGGIPDYCLPDFFANLLHPALTRREWIGLDVDELILEWLDSPIRANEPVRRFVLYGGKIAENFVARCLTMAQRLTMAPLDDQTSKVAVAEKVGLPQRVINSYQQWVQNRERTITLSAGLRLRRPRLLLEPWNGEGIEVELPSQLLVNRPPPTCCWVVMSDNERFSERVYASRRSNGWETEEAWLLLKQPSATCTVIFDNGEGLQRRWHFPLLSPDTPLMAFDPETEQLLTWNAYMPAHPLWLLYPAEIACEVVGGQLREVFERLPGAWYAYRIEHWELTQAQTIILGEQTIPVQQDAATLRPRLEGGQILTLLRNDDDPTLYVGQPPEIVIPLSPQRDAESELQRWQITIFDSTGNCRYRGALNTHKEAMRQTPEAWHLPLEQLLDPFGTFEIHLRGPLGRDTRFLLALVPALRISGHDHLRVVGRNNCLPDAHFFLKTAPNLELSTSDPDISISNSANFYRVQAPASYTKADLYLVKPSDGQDTQVAFSVPLPVLRWRVIDRNSAGEWSVTPLVHSVAWFDQVEAPCLQVMVTPHISTRQALFAQLRVGRFANRPYRRNESSQILNPRGKNKKQLSFNLQEAADSIHSSDEPSISFELLLHTPSGETSVPLLHLTQALKLEQFELDHCLVDDQWCLLLEWKGNPLRNRYLRLWPLWRPWEAPIDLPIPDGGLKEHDWVESLSHLSPGAYRAQMTVIQPWSSAPPPHPRPDEPNIIDLKLGSDTVIEHYLRNRANEVPGLLEQALASTDESACWRALRPLKERFEPQYIDHCLLTLVRLTEYKKIGTAILTDQSRISTLFQNLLLKSPSALLISVVRQWHQEACTWEKLEVVLWHLDANMTRLLRSAQQEGDLIRDDLLKVVQLSPDNLEAQADLESFLSEVGIEVREKSKKNGPQSPTLLPDEAPAEWFDDIRQLYFYEIRQIDLLKAEEEQRLATRYQDGREAARELWALTSPQSTHTHLLQDRVDQAYEARKQLIMANQRLVVSIAKKYSWQLPLLDLIQEGNLGLMKAIQKFDPKKGYKFSTYAIWWIRQTIRRAVADYGRTIRLPSHVADKMNEVARTSGNLMQQLGREPTAEEIVLKSDDWLPAQVREKILETRLYKYRLNPLLSKQLKEATYKVKRLRTLSQSVASLDAPIADEDGSSLGDLIPDKQNQGPVTEIEQLSLREEIKQSLNFLNPRQRQIITLRYGLQDGQERTLEEVGKLCGVTRERIRQIQKKALDNLRRYIMEQLLHL